MIRARIFAGGIAEGMSDVEETCDLGNFIKRQCGEIKPAQRELEIYFVLPSST